ncbi:UNC93-like protein MFSD11 isoform X1 [Hyposmocoma kahamanoa]|uniref:UNC93-like protein MFSD11 isoform X1 n=1 Tax=Hyposmocoma kahamanoa TaxID=1477025 RepID=UPI000E6D623A|nr:UNC93-like protein MFSD11 isoform X1 [Hyposmocoma kahamanoa]
MERRFVNIILLGFGFMFVFTAFQTMGNIEKTILDSISQDDSSFTGDGYTSLAIIYATLAICNWMAPSVITITGPRGAMLIGATTYLFFIVTFLFPRTWLLYAASVLIGMGAAAIWTGQGNYLTLNSDADTISRNSGVFWAMLQCSLFFGNLFVFIKFQGKTHIDVETRNVVFGALTAVCAVGIIFLILLRPARRAPNVEDAKNEVVSHEDDGPLDAFKGALKLFCTRDMLLLSVTFIYTGVELSFFSGVYSPSIGFTLSMGENAKQLVGLSGVFIGLGEVLGGALFGILGSKTSRWGRDPIVIMGYLIHLASFFLIFINLPAEAPFGDTTAVSYIDPSPYLAMFCSFLLGFGDACFNTQIYSILGGNYADNSTSAFALFKFTQSLAAAACFFYSSQALLTVQLSVLAVLATLGTAAFVRVEWVAKARARAAALEIIDDKPVPSENALHYD